MKSVFKAGAEVDFLTKGELDDSLDGINDKLLAILAKDTVNYRRASGAIPITAAGTVSAVVPNIGPNAGFYWNLRRISLSNTAASGSAGQVGLFVNDGNPASLIAPGVSVPSMTTFSERECLLYANDTLFIYGTGLTYAAGAELVVACQVDEIRVGSKL